MRELVITVSGSPKTGKTTIAAEIMRTFAIAGFDVKVEDSPDSYSPETRKEALIKDLAMAAATMPSRLQYLKSEVSIRVRTQQEYTDGHTTD